MMMHSPMMKSIGMVTWLITALVSINMLTGMYDYNFILWLGNQVPGLVVPLCWIIGISGILSLIMLVKAIMMCGSDCGMCECKSGMCTCNNKY